MKWLESIRKTVEVIEENLLDEAVLTNVAQEVAISPLYLQKGFQTLTGYTPSEYVRNRRLYCAALDLLNTSQKIIDIALKYGYETPESFTKAFSRFHGVTPTQLRKDSSKMTVFLPLTIQVSISGGDKMDYVIEKMDSFKVIGWNRRFSFENSYEMIPKFWDEVYQKYVLPYCDKPDWPQGETQKAVAENNIGSFGVCIEEDRESDFDYMVAGLYKGGEVPSDMRVFEVPALTWAKFRCKGPLPGALQSINTKIFKQWLPGNPDWELSAGFNLEYYTEEGGPDDADYESQIWIPVKPAKC